MSMIEVKTSNLIGAALDWSVAKACDDRRVYVLDSCVIYDEFMEQYGDAYPLDYSPSTDWSQGGPLIEKYKLQLHCDEPSASYLQSGMRTGYTASTVLIAAMRAIVSAKLGDVVSVPSELVGVVK